MSFLFIIKSLRVNILKTRIIMSAKISVFVVCSNIYICYYIIYNMTVPYQYQITISYGTKYSRVDQVKFFKDCLPKILLGPLLNTVSHIFHIYLHIFGILHFRQVFNLKKVTCDLSPRWSTFSCTSKIGVFS